jgi:pyridoxine/pyridoxamine 5'-phosphate oxidase
MNLEDILSAVFIEFIKATKVKRHAFRYVVLSTSDAQVVSSRWVVFRKFTDHESFLVFTDARSAKVDELIKNDCANMLFFNSKNGLQVRVDGNVVMHRHNELTKKYWPGVKGISDQSYTTELGPGTPIDDPEKAFNWDTGMNDENFMVLELVPKRLEVLQLNGNQHIRIQFNKKIGGWEGTYLVP